MNVNRLLLATLCLTIAALPSSSAQQPGPDTTAGWKIQLAEGAAKRWLALVDGAGYAPSWDSAAVAFKSQITRTAWIDAVFEARSQVDPLGARRLASAQYTHELPKAPTGDYVVLQFSTIARDHNRVTETVVLTLDPDGAWRVVGYFIKPG